MIISKRIKYLGVNLSKEAKDLYSETQKTLMKETDDNTDKKILCSQIKRIYIVKMTILPKDIYKFNATPNTLSMAFFSQNQSKNTSDLNGNMKDP